MEEDHEDNVEGLRVFIRMRPPNKAEVEMNSAQVVEVHEETTVFVNTESVVNLKKLGERAHKFRCKYDHVFEPSASQEDVFDYLRPAVSTVLEGFNACIFAYGQTGAGKTHTMLGPEGGMGQGGVCGDQQGLIPRAVSHLFNCLAAWKQNAYAAGNGSPQTMTAVEAAVHCSYLQIYNEQLHDLLQSRSGESLRLREAKKGNKGHREVYVSGLSEFRVDGTDDVLSLLSQGTSNRSIRSTEYNESSSRSHAILQISVEVEERGPEGLVTIKRGKLSLVDLAGSERFNVDTDMTKAHLKEMTSINMSLSALGNVMNALCDKRRKHIPYRDSKLTRLLQDSLGGNTKTAVIACISPCLSQIEETISTLYFADRAKQVMVRVRRNEVVDDKELLKRARREIKRLKEQVKVLMEQNEASNEQGRDSEQMKNSESSTQGGSGLQALQSPGSEAQFKRLKVQVSRLIEENAALKEENRRMQMEASLMRSQLRQQKQRRRKNPKKAGGRPRTGSAPSSGYNTATDIENSAPLPNSRSEGALPVMIQKPDSRWDRINKFIFGMNTIEEEPVDFEADPSTIQYEPDVELAHLAAVGGRSYQAQDRMLAQAHARCAEDIQQERESMAAAKSERELLEEQLAALMAQASLKDEELTTPAIPSAMDVIQEVTGQRPSAPPDHSSRAPSDRGYSKNMPPISKSESPTKPGFYGQGRQTGGWVGASPSPPERLSQTSLDKLLPNDTLRGQVQRSPRISKNRGRMIKNRMARVSRSTSSANELRRRDPSVDAKPKRPGALAYTNEDLGMILTLYSFRYDQWDECTIIGVDRRKKLHCCHYSEEGTKHWHDLRQKKYKIVGFNGQMRVIESAPESETSKLIHSAMNRHYQQTTNYHGNEPARLSNKLHNMAQQYSGRHYNF